ncbi:spore coat protein [Alkaliphilus serpentinus]|uniref:Spore coat protein n=1 Tax=Alkaliphilus serpentinus TaxID=1482731 RepID=A0A833HN46_9FIRM|nr:spore coat protein [Alkaliphilus serpentinus]
MAPREAFEIHELLTHKNIACTKSSVMAALVKDEALKEILQQDFKMGQNHIRDLRNLLLKSELTNVKTSNTQDMGGTIRH